MSALADEAQFLEGFSKWAGEDQRDIYTEVYGPRRRESPVCPEDVMGFGPLLDGVGAEYSDVFTLLGFDVCDAALLNAHAVSSSIFEQLGLAIGRSILGMDGEEHQRHRALVSHAFRQKALAKWESGLIHAVVYELIDEILQTGRETDLVHRFNFALPSQVIAAMIGLPREDYPVFQRLSLELLALGLDPMRGMAASAELRDYFEAVLAERRRNPSDDLVSDLINAELDGEQLTDEDIHSSLRLLIVGGIETTFRSLGSLLLLLLEHPAQFEAVKRDRSLIPRAIEEALRCESPLQAVPRRTLQDVSIGGVEIPAGAVVIIGLGAANHDPARWDRPDEFDVMRSEQRHLAFAFGPHHCLGLHLARLESRVALNAIFDRLDDLELVTENDPHIGGLLFRSPASLPVRFGAT